MDVLKVYNALPADVKLKMLEDKVHIMLDIISEIELAIKHDNLMPENSKLRKSFYRKYHQLFHIENEK